MKLLAILSDSTDNLNASEIGAIFMMVVGAGLAIYDVAWQHQHFDIQGFGIGAGALVGAIGAAQRLRGDKDIELRKLGQ